MSYFQSSKQIKQRIIINQYSIFHNSLIDKPGEVTDIIKTDIFITENVNI